MATTNYAWVVPVVGGSTDTWGQIVNDAFEAVDTELKRVEDLIPSPQDLSGYALLTGAIFTGAVTSTSFSGPLTGNADTSTALANARGFSLGGIITSNTVNFDGTNALTLTTSIADNALTIAKTNGLQTALDAKEPTLAANRKLVITSGTADPGALAVDEVYFKREA